MFARVTIHHEGVDYNVVAMIDSEITENFLNQLKMREMRILSGDKMRPGLEIFDDTPLRIYDAHVLSFSLTDSRNNIYSGTHAVVAAQMDEVDMILNMLWLATANPKIDWKTHT